MNIVTSLSPSCMVFVECLPQVNRNDSELYEIYMHDLGMLKDSLFGKHAQ
jgi:hypothetical protein